MNSPIARVFPSSCKIAETYKFAHRIEDKHQIECTSTNGIVAIEYCLDGFKYKDLDAIRNKTMQDPIDSITVGFICMERSNKAQVVKVPVTDLTESLSRGDIIEKSYEFALETLHWVPLRIEAKIQDERNSDSQNAGYFEAHEFNEQLILSIQVTINLPVETLRSSPSMVRQLNQFLSGRYGIEVIRVPQGVEQKREIVGPAIAAIANSGSGGVLIFGLGAANAIIGIDDAKADEIVKLVYAYSLEIDPPALICRPVRFSADGKTVIMVEVPADPFVLSDGQRVKRNHTYNGQIFKIDPITKLVSTATPDEGVRKRGPYDYSGIRFEHRRRLSPDEAEREIKSGPSKSTCFLQPDFATLASTQAALANAGGGRIFIGVRNNGFGKPGEILGVSGADSAEIMQQVSSNTHPWVPVTQPYIVQADGKSILVQDVPQNVPDLYRTDESFLIHDGVSPQVLGAQDAMDILRDRHPSTKAILATPKPMLRKLSLDWIEFPVRNHAYNPQTGNLEWSDVSFKEDVKKPGLFSCMMTVQIARAKELFDRKRLTGAVDVEIENVLLASPSIYLYDPLGHRQSPEWHVTTRLHSDITLSLPDILRRRSYSPSRSLSLMGIEPRPERLRDIIRAFNDAGVMITGTKAGSQGAALLLDGVRLVGEKQGIQGVTALVCDIRGFADSIKRRVQQGQRTDEKDLTSGIIELQFGALTEEAPIQAIRLLNEIVDSIHHRFQYLRSE